METELRERFLTVRWNNMLTLALGLPALLFVVFAISTSISSGRGAMIGLAIIGVLY